MFKKRPVNFSRMLVISVILLSFYFLITSTAYADSVSLLIKSIKIKDKQKTGRGVAAANKIWGGGWDYADGDERNPDVSYIINYHDSPLHDDNTFVSIEITGNRKRAKVLSFDPDATEQIDYSVFNKRGKQKFSQDKSFLERHGRSVAFYKSPLNRNTVNPIWTGFSPSKLISDFLWLNIQIVDKDMKNPDTIGDIIIGREELFAKEPQRDGTIVLKPGDFNRIFVDRFSEIKIKIKFNFSNYFWLNGINISGQRIAAINFKTNDIVFIHKRYARIFKIKKCYVVPDAIDKALEKYLELASYTLTPGDYEGQEVPGGAIISIRSGFTAKQYAENFDKWYDEQEGKGIDLLFYLLPSPPLAVNYLKRKRLHTPLNLGIWKKITKILDKKQGHVGASYALRSEGINCTFNNNKYEIAQQATYNHAGYLCTQKHFVVKNTRYTAPGTPDLQALHGDTRSDKFKDYCKNKDSSHTANDLQPWLWARTLDKREGGNSYKLKYLAHRPPNRSRLDINKFYEQYMSNPNHRDSAIEQSPISSEEDQAAHQEIGLKIIKKQLQEIPPAVGQAVKNLIEDTKENIKEENKKAFKKIKESKNLKQTKKLFDLFFK